MKATNVLKGGVKYTLLAIAYLFFVFPLYWLFEVSIKPQPEWSARPPVWFTMNPTFSNYDIILGGVFHSSQYIGTESAVPAMTNSLIIAGGATLVSVIVGYLAAYAISRYGTGGSFSYYFVLLTRMSPPIAFAIPLLVFFSTLGLIDTHGALIYMYSGFTVAYVIWMVKGFIDDIPREIEEAAILDGCSTFDVIFRVTLPLLKGGIAASALFVFVLNWSEFLFALSFTHIRAYTITVQIGKYFAQAGWLYGPVAALSVVATIPLIIFGYLIQNYLVRGLTFGAVRGRR